MNHSPLLPKTGENFAVADLGPFSDLSRFVFEAEKLPKVEGKIFLKQLLGLTSAEISLNKLLPQKSIPFYHKHRLNEEIYIFIDGDGEFQVDGCVFAVTAGSVVRVDPNGERCIRNCSDTHDLNWITIQSRANSYTDCTIEDGVGVQKRVSWVNKSRI